MPEEKYYITEGSKAWVEYVLRHKNMDYAQKYTKDIYLPNCFSSSTLAFSVEKVIDMKQGIVEEIKKKAGVVIGDAIHDYLQSRLSDKYVVNREFRYTIPFKWKSLQAKDIVIISHPDAFSLEEKQIIEFKTSIGLNANGHIKDYMKRQVSLYWKKIYDQYGVDCDARVVKAWSDEKFEVLNIAEDTLLPHQKIKFSDEMIARAVEAATVLDEIYTEKGVPQPPSLVTKHKS